jgi:hypothetical protein
MQTLEFPTVPFLDASKARPVRAAERREDLQSRRRFLPPLVSLTIAGGVSVGMWSLILIGAKSLLG